MKKLTLPIASLFLAILSLTACGSVKNTPKSDDFPHNPITEHPQKPTDEAQPPIEPTDGPDVEVEDLTVTEKGLSIENAIEVMAYNELDGVPWEYDWLVHNACLNNQGYQGPKGQALLNENGHNYDKIETLCNDGTVIDYYFMIDNYFGKF